tara:strand:+ start:35 stop:145 length:111 start_codon:yes stop_codon:yes gene_type:complete
MLLLSVPVEQLDQQEVLYVEETKEVIQYSMCVDQHQ